MNGFDTQRAGTALLRISLGVMFLAHSVILKYCTFTLAGTAQYFASIGLPASFAYVVFAVEAIAGVLLILGIQTRWTALATVPVLIGATLSALLTLPLAWPLGAPVQDIGLLAMLGLV